MQRFLFRLFTLCLLCALPAPAQFGIFKPSKPATKPTPDDPLAGRASKQPDKELFDKALIAMKSTRCAPSCWSVIAGSKKGAPPR
jgi:outer membrane protein assembly factor BamD